MKWLIAWLVTLGFVGHADARVRRNSTTAGHARIDAAQASRLNGTRLNALRLNGPELGVAVPGLEIGKGGLVGAILTGSRADGTLVSFEVRAGREGTGASNLAGIWFYDVLMTTKEGTRPFCGTTADGAPISAIALEGQWIEKSGTPGAGSKIPGAGGITFACRGFALAKCVEWGYRPWVTHPVLGSLERYHQACVRLVRADYCGDGRSFTRTGTPVNLYDQAGIQKDTEAWLPEAEWGEKGAVCLNHRRLGNAFPWPDCLAKQSEETRKTCGQPKHFSKDVLLISESVPPPAKKKSAAEPATPQK